MSHPLFTAFLKTEAARNPALLRMAEGRHCMLRVPGVCRDGMRTTVACHSNQAIHGKGARRKADDHFSAWGCFHCHTWLDQGMGKRADKEAVFEAAMARQLIAWQRVAEDASEPERFREAARWALERHGRVLH